SILRDPCGISRIDVLEGEGVDGRQFVGMQLADGAFDGGKLLLGGLEEHAGFLLAGDRGHHRDGFHLAGPSSRSAGTMMTFFTSLPAITDKTVSTPMRWPPSNRTRSS